jgi:hypothetical protein
MRGYDFEFEEYPPNQPLNETHDIIAELSKRGKLVV